MLLLLMVVSWENQENTGEAGVLQGVWSLGEFVIFSRVS